MSRLSRFRSRFHPGSYFWALPSLVSVILTFANLAVGSLTIAIQLSIISLEIFLGNFLIWIYQRGSSQIIVMTSLNAILLVFISYRVSTGCILISLLTLCVVVRTSRLHFFRGRKLESITVYLILSMLSWNESQPSHRKFIVFLGLNLAFLISLFFQENLATKLRIRLVGAGLLISSVYLLFSSILVRSWYVAALSLSFILLFYNSKGVVRR